MKADSYCMAKSCPKASSTVQLFEIEVSLIHPLLLLNQALPWAAITETMVCHWRQDGKNVDGGPGLPWDVSCVPLVMLLPMEKSVTVLPERSKLFESHWSNQWLTSKIEVLSVLCRIQ